MRPSSSISGPPFSLTPTACPYGIGVIPTIAPYLLPRVAPRIGDDSPLKVHWLEMQTQDCNEGLVSGDLDAILIADPPSSEACEGVELGWEPFYLVGPPGSLPIGPTPVETLKPEQLMLLDEGHCLREHTLSLCELSASRTSPYRGTSLPTVVQMVAAGLGNTVVPAVALPRGDPRPRTRCPPVRAAHWPNRSAAVAVEEHPDRPPAATL